MLPPDEPPVAATTEKVGFCSPPKSKQWVKGQSGNPAGKKKGTKNFGTQFQTVATKAVTVKEGDHTKKVTLMELVINAPLVHGINGDMKNAAHALKLAEEFGIQEPSKLKSGTIVMMDSGKYKTAWWMTPMTDEDKAAIDELKNILYELPHNSIDDDAGHPEPAE